MTSRDEQLAVRAWQAIERTDDPFGKCQALMLIGILHCRKWDRVEYEKEQTDTNKGDIKQSNVAKVTPDYLDEIANRFTDRDIGEMEVYVNGIIQSLTQSVETIATDKALLNLPNIASEIKDAVSFIRKKGIISYLEAVMQNVLSSLVAYIFLAVIIGAFLISNWDNEMRSDVCTRLCPIANEQIQE